MIGLGRALPARHTRVRQAGEVAPTSMVMYRLAVQPLGVCTVSPARSAGRASEKEIPRAGVSLGRRRFEAEVMYETWPRREPL